jgi:hypothetical protein
MASAHSFPRMPAWALTFQRWMCLYIAGCGVQGLLGVWHVYAASCAGVEDAIASYITFCIFYSLIVCVGMHLERNVGHYLWANGAGSPICWALESYQMCFIVQGSCSALQNNACSFNREIRNGNCQRLHGCQKGFGGGQLLIYYSNPHADLLWGNCCCLRSHQPMCLYPHLIPSFYSDELVVNPGIKTVAVCCKSRNW